MSSAAQRARTARASQSRGSQHRRAEPPTEELKIVAAGSAATVLRQNVRTTARPSITGTPGGKQSETKPELSLVPALPQRKVPFIVLCLGVLVSALAVVLVLNITVSANQYQLVELRSQQMELVKRNDQLAQQQQLLQSPQNLAAKARELGMVTPSNVGQVNVDTGTIAGNPAPAEKTDAPPPLIVGPQIPGQQNVAAQRYDNSGQNSQGTTQAPPAGQNPSAADLGGGTIPAPQQRPMQ